MLGGAQQTRAPNAPMETALWIKVRIQIISPIVQKRNLAQHYVSLVLSISRRLSNGSILFAAHYDTCSPRRSQGGSRLHCARHDHRDRVRFPLHVRGILV